LLFKVAFWAAKLQQKNDMNKLKSAFLAENIKKLRKIFVQMEKK
jgi:hypothetical protein